MSPQRDKTKPPEVPPDKGQAAELLAEASRQVEEFGFSSTALRAVEDAYVTVAAGTGGTCVCKVEHTVDPPHLYQLTVAVMLKGLLRGERLWIYPMGPMGSFGGLSLPIVQDGDLTLFIPPGKYQLDVLSQNRNEVHMVVSAPGEVLLVRADTTVNQ